MRIVAFDPGGTTGWVTHTLFLDKVKSNVDIAKSVTRGEFKGKHHNELWSLLYEFNPDILVYERFDYQIRTDESGHERLNIVLDSVEYIGIFELWDQQHEKCLLVPQQQMKGRGGSQWTDEKLKHIGMYVEGSEHINDAQRQLLSYVCFGTPKRTDYLNLLRRS